MERVNSENTEKWQTEKKRLFELLVDARQDERNLANGHITYQEKTEQNGRRPLLIVDSSDKYGQVAARRTIGEIHR